MTEEGDNARREGHLEGKIDHLLWRVAKLEGGQMRIWGGLITFLTAIAALYAKTQELW